MLDEIMPSVFKRLRQEAGLSKTALASLIHCDRSTVTRFENGTSLPNAKQVKKLLELAKCTHERAGDIVCDELGKRLGKTYRALPGDVADASATWLEKAEMLVTRYPHRLPPILREALHAKIDTMHLVGMANQGHTAELRKLVERGLLEVNNSERDADPDRRLPAPHI